MYFASDNWAGAHPAISSAIADNSTGFMSGYNSGDLDQKVRNRFAEIFETEVTVFFVSTGTAANSISIALTARPGSVCFAHEESHVVVDECGAPEFFSSSRICQVPGQNGKMDIDRLVGAIARYPASFVHHGRPGAISITQATETGTVHSIDEIAAFSRIAQANGIMLHMDGARFANALVSLGATPAEMTWKSGVDLLSFGGTKNGCWCAEAIVCFRPELAEELAFHHKRAGQLFSKSRFIAAQFDAYFTDNLWLEMASHANAMAARLAEGMRASGNARLAFEPRANEVFAILHKNKAAALQQTGAVFYDWAIPASHPHLLADAEENLYRFVASFATTADHVDSFLEALS